MLVNVAFVPLHPIPAKLACLAFVLDRGLAQASGEVGIVARVGLRSGHAGELLVIDRVTNYFHRA